MIDRDNWDAAVNAADGPMEYGADDCCQWVSCLVRDAYGFDLMAGVPDYTSQAEAEAVFNQYGGLVEAAIALAKGCGLQKAAKPYPEACVGLVLGQFGPALAIRRDGWWIARADVGVAMLADRYVIMAWGLPCHQ